MVDPEVITILLKSTVTLTEFNVPAGLLSEIPNGQKDRFHGLDG